MASPLVFKKFKEFLESRYGSPLKIEFRHKENGEGSYFYYEGTTGTYMIPNYKKSYPYAFATGLIIAEDCTDCNYCTLNRFGDITLGDYVSGVTDYSKSTIFANTQKGMDFINRCQSIILKEENLQDVTAKSWHLTTANTFNPQREEVFTNIDKSWEYLEKKYFHLPSWSQRYKQALLNKFKKVNKL